MKFETFIYASTEQETEKAFLFKYPEDISVDRALFQVGNFVALYHASRALVGEQNHEKALLTTSKGAIHKLRWQVQRGGINQLYNIAP